MQPGEIVAAHAIQEPALNQVDVQEAQRRPKGQAVGPALEPTPQVHRGRLQLRVRGQESRLDLEPGLPGGVAVVLFDENVDRGKGIVIHLTAQPPCRAGHDNVLVDFIVPTLRGAVNQLLVTARAMAKEAQVPVRVVGMPQPRAHEHKSAVDPIARATLAILREKGADLRGRLRGHHFVRVHDEDPFVAKGQVFERPVFLLRPQAVEVKLHDLRAGRGRERGGVVRALGIDHEDLFGPRHGGEAAGEVRRLVADRNQDGERDLGGNHGGVGTQNRRDSRVAAVL